MNISRHKKQTLVRLGLLSAVAIMICGPFSAYAAAIPGDPLAAVSASMDGGTTKAGNTWYQIGVNLASPTTGLKTGIVSGQSDPASTYLFEPADQANALLLDSGLKAARLSLATPVAVSALSFAGSSGNGAGTNTFTLHFTDGSSVSLTNKVVFGDWFNNTNIVQAVGGRIDLGANSFNSVSTVFATANPRVLANNLILPANLATLPLSAIDIS